MFIDKEIAHKVLDKSIKEIQVFDFLMRLGKSPNECIDLMSEMFESEECILFVLTMEKTGEEYKKWLNQPNNLVEF